MKKKENPPKGKGLEAGKPRAAARPKKGRDEGLLNQKTAIAGKPMDPVGQSFDIERYPSGAWLKVEPGGFCSEAYSAKWYGIVELPALKEERARDSQAPKTPRRPG